VTPAALDDLHKGMVLRASADPACGQGSMDGGLDVQTGGGEDGDRAVRVGDQQFDLGAAEHHTFGAGLN